jgi:hypothetical protein
MTRKQRRLTLIGASLGILAYPGVAMMQSIQNWRCDDPTDDGGFSGGNRQHAG